MGRSLLSLLLVISMAWPWMPVAATQAGPVAPAPACCDQGCACPPAGCPCCIEEAPERPATPARTATTGAARELDRLAADLVRVTGAQSAPDHATCRSKLPARSWNGIACRGRDVLLQSCCLQT